MTMDSPLIDSHVHFWDVNRRHYAWLEDFQAINSVHSMTEYDDARGGNEVAGIVFVECAGASDDVTSRDEVKWVQTLASKEDRVTGIVAFAPLEWGEKVAAHLDWLKEQPLVRGVRRLLQHEADPKFCLTPEFIEGTQMLGSRDLSLDICIFHFQMPAVIRLVETCPDVQFVLDHLGKPSIREKMMDPWAEHIQVLSSFPNVVCKISGAVTEADPETWTESDIRPYLEVSIDAFGDNRILFGSDWPVVNLASTYTEWIRIVRRTFAGFSGLNADRLFAMNADRIYRLGIRAPENQYES